MHSIEKIICLWVKGGFLKVCSPSDWKTALVRDF